MGSTLPGRAASVPLRRLTYDDRMQVNEFAAPLFAGTGRIGVLFCHGFTGSPWSLREWAQLTADAGYRVSLPRLPGHGTSWQEMNRTEWRDWYAAVDREFGVLSRECDQVFVAGMSMGGALALRLAERHPDRVAGLMLVNPAVQGYPDTLLVPLAHRFKRSTAAVGSDIAAPGVAERAYDRTPLSAANSMLKLWADVRASLDLVTCPAVVFRSATDHVVPAASTAFILSHISSDEIVEHVLLKSWHVATMDHDKEFIFRESLDFLSRHSA